MKSVTDICVEADNNKEDMKVLTELWDYVQKRRNMYKDSDREFIREHLNKYAIIIRQNAIREAARKQYESD